MPSVRDLFYPGQSCQHVTTIDRYGGRLYNRHRGPPCIQIPFTIDSYGGAFWESRL